MGKDGRARGQFRRIGVAVKKEKNRQDASNHHLMQEFSDQVKSINKDRPKIPKQDKRDDKKDGNTRQKAL
jgi:hypothetical protein